MIKRLFLLLLCVALVPGAGAGPLPDLGDVATSDLSPQAEQRLGESIMQELRGDPAFLDDAEVEGYIQRLGGRLAAVSLEPDRAFDFFVVNDRSLNAFALPGGHIGVHTGLVLAAESESELASVIGHEIAHVTQRHIAQLFGKQSQAGMVMLASLLVAVLAARSDSQVGEAALVAGQAGALQAQLAYTRSFEREADRLGIQILESAGYDVRGMPAFFERLQRNSRLYENKAPGYLRTHPLTQERIADMDNRVAQTRYKQVPDSPDFAYVRAKLRASDGLAVDVARDFEKLIAAGRSDFAARYGLARALLRSGALDDALKEVDAIRSKAPASPFVESLYAEIKLAQREPAVAVAVYEAAQKQFPEYVALRYGMLDALLQAGRAADASAAARAATSARRDDVRMWVLQSRAEAALGRKTAHHRAQAEVYVLRGSLPAAIEQLELARRAGDGDFFELSAADARMRELKAEHEARRRERQQR